MGACGSRPAVSGGDGLTAPSRLEAAVPKRGSMLSAWHSAIEKSRQSMGDAPLPRSSLLAKQVGVRADDLARIRVDLGHAHEQISHFLTAIGRGIESTESDSAYARKLHPELQANMVDAAAALAEVNSNLNGRLTRDVYTPIIAWQARERNMITQYRAVEKSRLELDARRRAVAKMERDVPRIAAGSREEAKLQNQISKRDALESAYVAMEEDLVKSLESLMVDPTMVQRLSALGMDAFTDALGRVAATLHVGLPPAPLVPIPSAEGVGIIGGMGNPNPAPSTPTHGRMAVTPTHSGRNTPTYAGTPTRAVTANMQGPFGTMKPGHLEVNEQVSSPMSSGISPGTPQYDTNGRYDKYERHDAAAQPEPIMYTKPEKRSDMGTARMMEPGMA